MVAVRRCVGTSFCLGVGIVGDYVTYSVAGWVDRGPDPNTKTLSLTGPK
jgi:hypothetical protein